MDVAMRAVQTADEVGLSERDQQILGFERQWWKYAGAKEQAIRELFDMSATRYYQVLNALIDDPAALVVDPMLVKRLRRMRASRQREGRRTVQRRRASPADVETDAAPLGADACDVVAIGSGLANRGSVWQTVGVARWGVVRSRAADRRARRRGEPTDPGVTRRWGLDRNH